MDKKINPKGQTFLRLLLWCILFLFCGFSSFVLSESVWRGSLTAAYFWMNGKTLVFLYTGMLAFFLGAGVCLFRRLSLSVFLENLLLFALAFLNYFKYEFRGEYLKLTDFSQAAEAAEISSGYSVHIPSSMLLFGGILLILMPLLFIGVRIESKNLSLRAVGAVLCMVLCVFCAGECAGHQNLGLEKGYDTGGLLGGLLNTMPGKMKKPSGYGRESVTAALNGVTADTASPEVRPDIFFIMCESMYDLSREGVQMSEDPLKEIHRLQEESWGGYLAVSQYGGGTAQTEYEVLTGYRDADTSGMAYSDETIVRPGMDTVASVLNGFGYDTVAIHPNNGKFYNREYAYSAMGFQRTLFSSDMEPTKDSDIIGYYPTDEYLFRQVIRDYEAHDPSRPYFAHIVTYQNHGEYLYDYEKRDITVEGTYSPDGEKSILNYVNGLSETGKQVAALLDYFKNSDRPVVVVLFGDHSPNVKLFDMEIGESEEESLISHTTPLLIWSNTDLQIPDSVSHTVSSYQLGGKILNLLGFRTDPYLNLVSSNGTANLFYLEDCILTGDSLTENHQVYTETSDRLKLLHYDRVYGKQYWKEGQQ